MPNPSIEPHPSSGDAVNQIHPSLTESPTALQHLVVAYDFSETAAMALGYARVIAKRFESQITLAYIETPAELNDAMEGGFAQAGSSRAGELTDLEQVTATLLKEGIRAGALIRGGPTTDILVQLAAELHPDLLFLGAYGHHGVNSTQLGSTAEFLLRSLRCPTMIVGPNVHRRMENIHLLEAVYATSVPAQIGPAESFLWALATRLPLNIHVIHVEPKPSKVGEGVQRNKLQIRESELVDRFRSHGMRADWTMEYGSQQERILEKVRNTSANLIVFGIEHAPNPSQMGVLNAIVREAPCPVITIPGAA